MSDKARFTPIRGIEDTLLSMPFVNGKIYFATDTGKMFLDCYGFDGIEKNKMPIGGGGVSLIYGQDFSPTPASEEEDNTYFSLRLAALESKASVNDLILNVDGCFYKVLSIEEPLVNCLRLAVSGSGGGGGPAVIEPDVRFNFGNYSYDYMSFIYGQETYIQFIPEAERDQIISLRFQIFDANNNSIYEKLFTQERANRLYQFNMGQVPMGTNLKMIITLISPNSNSHPNGLTRQISGLNVVKLGIRKDNSFSTASVKTGTVQVNYFIDGGEGFDLKIYPRIDESIKEDLIGSVDPGTTSRSINIPPQAHGVHEIGLKIGTTVANGTVYSDEIVYEIAWADPNETTPLIWVKEIPEVVVRYENCVIQYMVYDPVKAATGSQMEVNLLDSLINEEISTVYPQYSSSSSWLTWDLTENYHVGDNNFSISCGTETKEIRFTVTEEGSRKLGLVKPDSLKLNLSSAGRSNEESLAKRSSWTYTDANNNTYTTTFNNFNWYNNGWKNDNDGQGSYLSVANGSSVDINFTTIPFNTGNLSYSIELRFRVRNVQEYSTLVKTEPYYYIVDQETGMQLPDSVSINTIKEQGLKVAVDEDGNWLMDEAHSIKKSEFEKGVCFKFWDQSSKQGLFIGTQEAYFKTPNNTVSVRYKEDDIINLTITVDYQDLLSIYLNGVLAGAVAVGNTGFTFSTNKFEINSKYCDIDIYKLRVYETSGKSLTMPDVIHNYLSDEHNVKLYDENQLAKDNDATALSYDKIIKYNNAKLAELNDKVTQGQAITDEDYNILTMPYAVIEIIDNDTTMKDPSKVQHRIDDDRLPYVKGGKRYCQITFVNPVADALLEAGRITEEQYYSHSPSYRVVGCEIDVQGTSSQGYPRRNFKTKMKSATGGKDAESISHSDWGWFYTKGSKAGTKFKKWNMDNSYNSTNKFTWKIDYMESSGTYNTGFANLMGNMYDFHPLGTYNFDGVSSVGLRTTVYGFPVLTFQKHSKPSDKAKIGTTYEDEIYEFIGRYNLNLDKGSNEYYGFEVEGEQKYIVLPEEEQWDEEIENSDGTTSTIHHIHPAIADVAECWELLDNQGTWTSFTYPNSAQETHFATYSADSYNTQGELMENPKLEVIRHFECRYQKYADFIEVIADDEKPYDLGTVTAKINSPDTKPANKVIWESINTIPKMNRFIVDKWKNLETLMTWLDSTNTSKANPNRDIEPVTYEVTAVPSDMTGATLDVINDINYITFTKDTAVYRLEKFRNEFSKHLNLTYCAIYYILTELLLCYDSRGKNMMLASWGPQEVGGDYIWFPIFYDIDTQLGLNNIGATLWDYDTDASLEGTFSTPSSVLWVNFAAVFEDIIINTYKTLRSTKLTETNIEGAYLCDPSVFDSYAMRGVRPVIAIGLDEYVKYLKPSVDGFLNTDGIVQSDSYGYVYAINGDRKLSRELLIRNRLNYLDSYWRAGAYDTSVVSGAGACVIIRANANAQQTSDTYLDSNSLNELPPNANPNTTLMPYNTGVTAGLDAIPEYTLTPFLSQYVFTFFDKTPSGRSVKFQGTPVEVGVSDSVIDGYKVNPNLTQQITRIPGPGYISSLGDLSTKYLDQFQMENAKRLVDLVLGSDIEGYYNSRSMANFILNDSLYVQESNGVKKLNENRKTLLQKVILTNMQALGDAIDLSGSEKLQEFRALGTQIQGIQFAQGAPLTTIHLPKTVNGLDLVEAKNLTRILTSEPKIRRPIAEGSTFYDHETYEGLYIKNLTDIDNTNVSLIKNNNNKFVWQNVDNIYHDIKVSGESDGDVAPSLVNLSIKGGNLKYESYKLLLKALAVKENANTPGVRLKINYENLDWCPYTQLSIYDEYNSSQANKYYEATDHSTFKPYVWSSSTWNQLLKNGKIYYYNESEDENIINSLNLLDFFIQDYEEGLLSQTGLNHYTDMDSTSAHWPRLSGIIYIKNTNENPIQEDKLTSIYAEKWPDLKIFAAHVAESNLIKFVQISADGRENDLEVIRLATSQDHPVLPNVMPSKGTHYDFVGWSTDPAGTDMFIQYDFVNRVYYKDVQNEQDPSQVTRWSAQEVLNNYSFSSNGTTLILYAQFITHKQVVEFVYPDDTVIQLEIPYNNLIVLPDKVPYKDDTNLPLEQTYQFLGWNYTFNEDNSNAVINKNTFKVTQDFLRSNNNAMQTVWATYGYNDNVSPELFGTLKPVSVYENVHEEWFEFDSLGNNTYSAKLTKEVKGKVVYPHVYNNLPVREIGSTVNNKKDPILNNVTHVFLAHDPNTLETNIQKVRDYTFYNSNNLEYFEFTAKGLLTIGSSAFNLVKNLAQVNVIGGTIITINANAFVDAFGVTNDLSERTLIILANNLQQNSFSNFNTILHAQESQPNAYFGGLQIGSADQKFTGTIQSLQSGSNQSSIFRNNAKAFRSITIYNTQPIVKEVVNGAVVPATTIEDVLKALFTPNNVSQSGALDLYGTNVYFDLG